MPTGSLIESFTRINKYICESGLCSRKTADEHVKQGVVLINGERAKLGDKVASADIVTVNGMSVKPLADENIFAIALNKPVGVVCTAASHDKRNIVDFVGHHERIVPIGRLDKDSQGLILLTNKSALVNWITQAGNGHEKEYRVTVNKKITDEFLASISKGVPMLDVVTKNCQAVKISTCVFKITLVQGLNRQIRRMCKHYSYSVVKLERLRIMHIRLDGLDVGEWRVLSSSELSLLLEPSN